MSFFKLLKNADVYAPKHIGKKDLLLAGEKIAAMADELKAPEGYECEVIDLAGKKLMPGFIDSHVHLIGGGGEGGYATRTPEIVLSSITTSGVTTCAGLLGTDGTTRHVESLLAKARALETEGITTYIYTGAYQLPTPTFTGSVRDDIIIIDKVIGAGEIALSDHRSAQPTLAEYRKLVAEARVGGMLSAKAGIVDMHTGDGKDGLKFLWEICENGEIPKTQFLPTHMNRNGELFKESIEWAKAGGIMDITSGISDKEPGSRAVKPAKAVKLALDAGAPLANITMSSDGQGSMPIFDEKGNTIGVGVGSQKTMLTELGDMVKEEGIDLEDALQVVTSNVARVLKLAHKGQIKAGLDADITVLNDDLSLAHVFARGQHMVKDGEPIVFGTFEGLK